MNDAAFQNLKAQIQKGDDRGLQYVFEQSSRYCVGTLIKKSGCSLADAEDIYMDAILIFRENMLSGKLDHLSNLQTYAFGICWNVWRDLNRARSRWAKEQDEIERQLFLLMTHPDEGPDKGLIRQVQDALSQLGEKCRKLLTYVYIEQRPQKEIAAIMGFASPGVVKVTRHRCYKQWKDKIETAKVS